MATATSTPRTINEIWSDLTSPGRIAMFGHDRDELTADESAVLARRVAEARKSQLNPTPSSSTPRARRR